MKMNWRISAFLLAGGIYTGPAGELRLDANQNSTAGQKARSSGEKNPGSVNAPVLSGHGKHIGDYLLGQGRIVLEQQIGYQPGVRTKVTRWILQNANAFYLSCVFLLTILSLVAVSLMGQFSIILQSTPAQRIALIFVFIALLIPVLTVSTSLVNWLITLTVRPRILPKLNFKNEIPEPFHTLVVIPTLITSRAEIDSLAHQLELHYLHNPEDGLLFALLSDFTDADSQSLPEDEDLVQYAAASIEALNNKYNLHSQEKGAEIHPEERPAETPCPTADRLFYFLHRKRMWNPSEGKWIGWERKRGKLHELNLLLRGGKNFSFTTLSADIERKKQPAAKSAFCHYPRYRYHSTQWGSSSSGGHAGPSA